MFGWAGSWTGVSAWLEAGLGWAGRWAELGWPGGWVQVKTGLCWRLG